VPRERALERPSCNTQTLISGAKMRGVKDWCRYKLHCVVRCQQLQRDNSTLSLTSARAPYTRGSTFSLRVQALQIVAERVVRLLQLYQIQANVERDQRHAPDLGAFRVRCAYQQDGCVGDGVCERNGCVCALRAPRRTSAKRVVISPGVGRHMGAPLGRRARLVTHTRSAH
jgi:hypothetical protein